MRQNGISVIRTRKHKVTTIARQAIAKQSAERGTATISSTLRQTCWTGTSQLISRTRNGQVTSAISGRARVGFILRSTVASVLEPMAHHWQLLGPMADKVSLLDLHSRRVIGRAGSNAGRCRQYAPHTSPSEPKGCIHHTDRASQYCSHDYQKILRHHGFKASMSGKGNCYDNAAVETFFKTIKAELIWRDTWETRRQAEMAIFEYINASTIRDDATQHQAGKALSLSNGTWLKRALGRHESATGPVRSTVFSKRWQF